MILTPLLFAAFAAWSYLAAVGMGFVLSACIFVAGLFFERKFGVGFLSSQSQFFIPLLVGTTFFCPALTYWLGYGDRPSDVRNRKILAYSFVLISQIMVPALIANDHFFGYDVSFWRGYWWCFGAVFVAWNVVFFLAGLAQEKIIEGDPFGAETRWPFVAIHRPSAMDWD